MIWNVLSMMEQMVMMKQIRVRKGEFAVSQLGGILLIVLFILAAIFIIRSLVMKGQSVDVFGR